MTEQTDYHGWTIPTEDADTDQWSAILNDLIDGALEASVALRGPLTERPADAPANAVYHATDRRTLYRFNADTGAWEPFSEVLREGHPGASAAYRRLGHGSEQQLEHTQQVVGTRTLADVWPFIPRGGVAESWSYNHPGNGEVLTQAIHYGMLEQPPNGIPILKAYPVLSTESGARFEVGLTLGSQQANDWLMTFRVGPDADQHYLYDEVRLDNVAQASAPRGPAVLKESTFQVYAGINDSAGGTIHGSSSFALEWEVI